MKRKKRPEPPKTGPLGTKGTDTCITCLRTAKAYTGHVHLEKERILAGFCGDDRCITLANRQFWQLAEECTGCYGPWLETNGISLV